LPKGFETLMVPAKALMIPADEANTVRDAALIEWQNALSK
jgi:thiamine transport system substrate-binding protein